MPDFNNFLKILKNDLTDLAKDFGGDVKEELVKDGDTFAKKAKVDLERWILHLADGSLTKEDFEFLVMGKKDLAEMEMLKQKGLAKAKLDRYKKALLEAAIGAALKVIPL